MASLDFDNPALAECYDGLSIPQYRQGLRLLDALDIQNGQALLDLGCGTGRVTIEAAKRVGHSGSVIGMDPLVERIVVARRSRLRQLRFEVGALEALQRLPDQSFDRIFMNSVLHWIQDKRAVLAEIRRLLRPAGLLGLTTVSGAHTNTFRAATRDLKRFSTTTSSAHATKTSSRVSATELHDLYTETGFERPDTNLEVIEDIFGSFEELIAFRQASSFGNFLAEISHTARAEFLEAVRIALAPHCDSKGRYTMKRHVIFSVARCAPSAPREPASR